MPKPNRSTQSTRGRSVPKRQRSKLLLLASITVGVVALIAILAVIGRQGTTTATTRATLPVAIAAPSVPANAEPNGRAWGPKDAPITIIEYVDYECESCGYFARTFEHDVVTAFAPTGKVRFEIRNAPFHGPGARNAAEGAYCAAEQNTFWPMHDSLFLNQPASEGMGMEAFSDERLNSIATKLGMDTEAFSICLSSNKYVTQVADDYAATQQAAITGTPTFIVNGMPYVGPQSVDDFRRIFRDVAPDVSLNP